MITSRLLGGFKCCWAFLISTNRDLFISALYLTINRPQKSRLWNKYNGQINILRISACQCLFSEMSRFSGIPQGNPMQMGRFRRMGPDLGDPVSDPGKKCFTNFKVIDLGRYLELSERPTWKTIAKTCLLSIALLRTMFPGYCRALHQPSFEN